MGDEDDADNKDDDNVSLVMMRLVMMLIMLQLLLVMMIMVMLRRLLTDGAQLMKIWLTRLSLDCCLLDAMTKNPDKRPPCLDSSVSAVDYDDDVMLLLMVMMIMIMPMMILSMMMMMMMMMPMIQLMSHTAPELDESQRFQTNDFLLWI